MASDIWLRTIVIVRKETCCRHIEYSFRLTARVLLYAPSYRQDNTYQSLCYTSHGALAGTRNSSMGPSHEGSIRRPIAPRANSLTTELHLAAWFNRLCVVNGSHHTYRKCNFATFYPSTFLDGSAWFLEALHWLDIFLQLWAQKATLIWSNWHFHVVLQTSTVFWLTCV